MPLMNRVLAVAVVPLLLHFAACGGVQRVDAESPPPWSESVLDAIPSDAHFVLAHQFEARDTPIVEAESAGLLAMASPPATLMLQAIERELGIEVDRQRGIDQFGIDSDGAMVLFVRQLAPTVVFTIGSPAAFSEFVGSLQEASPDAPWEEIDIDGVRFTSARLQPHVRVDIGRRGGFGVFRLAMTEGGVERARAELREIIHGVPAEQRFLRTEHARELVAGADPAAITGLGYVDAAFLSQLISEFMRRAGASYMLGQPRQDLDTLYGTAERRASCEQEARRLISLVPWSGFVSERADRSPDTRSSTAVLRLSAEARDQMSNWFPGTFSTLTESATDAALQGEGHADLATIWSSLAGGAEYVNCPDLSLLRGLISFVHQGMGRQVAFNLELFDGRGGFALFDAELAALIPMVDALVVIGSPDPPRLTNIIQNRLRPLTRRASVVEGASVPTIELRLMTGHRIHLVQVQDRIVLAVGAVPQRALLAAATGASSSPGNALQLSADGAHLRPIVVLLNAYLAWSEIVPPELRPTVDGLLEQLHALEHFGLSASLSESALVVRTEITVEPSLVGIPVPLPDSDEEDAPLHPEMPAESTPAGDDDSE
ncbi:MAG: hypothetical protein EA398_18380 [Deltaproteobacteria bacterium]|nr:MAG: hypothetical protein EA398_18380 [Deltaproteobacteria bacterium]